MKRWSIFILVISVFLSVVSYGNISFDINPYIHPNSPGLFVDHDDLKPDRYILGMSKNWTTIYPIWQCFTSLTEASNNIEADNVLVTEYIPLRNYRVSKISSLAGHFNLKKFLEGYGWNKNSVYSSNTGSFYVNEYKGYTSNRFSISGFDDNTYKTSYDLNSLISEMYIAILIFLLLLFFLTVKKNMKFRSV